MELRSHFLTTLTNIEVEEYLAQNDAIIVPVGTVEMHGGLPSDCETVIVEALGKLMAEKAGCLVLPHLPYFYAGATAVGRCTVEVGVEEGVHYLKAVTRSLLRQGFHRIIFITLHGPAHMTVSPVIRDLGDETKAPLLYIDFVNALHIHAKELDYGAGSLNDMFFGAYDLLGRLEDIPLTTRPELDFSGENARTTARFNDITRYAPSSGSVAHYFMEHMDHVPTPAVPTAEYRQRHADQGVVLLKALVDAMNVPHILDQMTALEHYNHDCMAKYGDWLNF